MTPRPCGSAGGGCQFLRTAATSQVVGEALGLSVPHSALGPSGSDVWLEAARQSARAVVALEATGVALRDILTERAIRNAMVVHAAFGGSTSLLLHVPAVAHAAGLRRPTVDDWAHVNREVPRLVSVIPNGPDGIRAGDVMVVAGCGPMGTGMEEIYQVTAAIRHLPWAKEVAVITDARFSGLSTGACIGHASPEALVGGPLGRLRDGDIMEIVIDRRTLEASIDLVGAAGDVRGAAWGAGELEKRPPNPEIAPHPRLPDDTRLWSALQGVSGGTCGGCVYDADAIVAALETGRTAGGD